MSSGAGIMLTPLSLNVSCISTGSICHMSDFLRRYILNHYYNLRTNSIATKSLIMFGKVIQVHIKKVLQGEALLQHLKSISDTGGASVEMSVARLFAATSGILLVFDIDDVNSFRALKPWIDTLCKVFHRCSGAREIGRGRRSVYGVMVGIRNGNCSAESGAGAVDFKTAERFAYANNMQYFSIDLATSTQEKINKPIDLLSNLCAIQLLFNMHARYPARFQQFVPCFARALGSPHLHCTSHDEATRLHMVQRPGEPHTFQPKVLHSPCTHYLFSPSFRHFVLLMLLYRRYGAMSRQEHRRVSYVAMLPEEVLLHIATIFHC